MAVLDVDEFVLVETFDEAVAELVDELVDVMVRMPVVLGRAVS